MSADEIHKAGTNDGWHGKIEEGGRFPPEKGRYRLYIGFFCPFAHRANLARHLSGLTDVIPLTVVKPYPKGTSGFKFPATTDEYPGSTPDPVYGSEYLHQLYFKADKEYKGKFSVPMLWDTKEETIVCNESAEILRWLPSAFSGILPPDHPAADLYPESLRAEIDRLAPLVQAEVNAGVYKAGMRAQTQADYDAAVPRVFGALNRLEKLAAANGGPFLLGGTLTELDVRLYGSLVRFDVAYVSEFRCNVGMVRHDYPVLISWLRNLYWNVPGFKETTFFDHIKDGYSKNFPDMNMRSITPMGPYPDIGGPEGVETDFSRIPPGGVRHPAVLEAEKNL
ncbi:glutathione S-transferase omega-like 2 [Lineolata rhizophorae]|uniref:Glutathione S-transferase omega-like 2 n=1 Tax=Lineolata rhizophorae TaxID=578093 RepID=A0A6A6NQF8_9PEZI|nr:glutathione S-transferase omega-like 2 [Lineolata rhizophorae]